MTRLNSTQFVVLIVLFLVMELVDVPVIEWLSQVLIPITIATSFWLAKSTARLVAAIFLIAGLWLLVRGGVAPNQFISSFGEMLFVIAFFTVLPVIALPIRVGGYDQYIMTFILRHARSLRMEYAYILLVSYFYGIFLNLAAVPMSFRSLQSLLKHENLRNKERFLFFSMSQGFTTPLIWTPFSGMLGVIMISFGVNWVSIVPLLVVMSLVSLAACFVVYWQYVKHQQIPVSDRVEPEVAVDSESPYLIRLAELVGVVFLLLLVVFVLESWFELGLIISIIFITFPFTIGWCALKGRLRPFFESLNGYFQYQIPKMSSIYMIFLSAGFFVGTVQATGTDAVVSQYLLTGLALVPDWLIYCLLPWMIVATSYMGLHPIVTLVLLTGSVNLMDLGLSNELLAMAFLCGGVSTFLVSPFSGTVGILKSYTERSYADVILSNVPTVLVIYAVFMVTIQAALWNGWF